MRRVPVAKTVAALTCAAVLLITAPFALAAGKGWLGVVLQDITPSMAKALQLDEGQGVLVSDVVDDGPAARAGLEAGDVILSFAGAELDGYGDLTDAVRAATPGDEVDVVILRGGQRRTLTVEVGEREGGFTWSGKGGGEFHFDGDSDHDVWFHRTGDDDDVRVIMKGLRENRGFLGVHLDDLSEQLGEYFGVADGEGALVTEVVADGPAAAAGLKAGDVIVKIGDEAIASARDVHAALADTEPEQEVRIEIRRRGEERGIDVTLAEMPEGVWTGSHVEIHGDDGDFHVIAPKMLRRMPHMKRQLRMPAPEGRYEFHMHHDELEEMKEELGKLRTELEQMREMLKND